MAKYLHSELLEWPTIKVFDEVNILSELLEVSRETKSLQNERIKDQVREINDLRKVIGDLRVEMVDIQFQLSQKPVPMTDDLVKNHLHNLDGRKRPV